MLSSKLGALYIAGVINGTGLVLLFTQDSKAMTIFSVLLIVFGIMAAIGIQMDIENGYNKRVN